MESISVQATVEAWCICNDIFETDAIKTEERIGYSVRIGCNTKTLSTKAVVASSYGHC